MVEAPVESTPCRLGAVIAIGGAAVVALGLLPGVLASQSLPLGIGFAGIMIAGPVLLTVFLLRPEWGAVITILFLGIQDPKVSVAGMPITIGNLMSYLFIACTALWQMKKRVRGTVNVLMVSLAGLLLVNVVAGYTAVTVPPELIGTSQAEKAALGLMRSMGQLNVIRCVILISLLYCLASVLNSPRRLEMAITGHMIAGAVWAIVCVPMWVIAVPGGSPDFFASLDFHPAMVLRLKGFSEEPQGAANYLLTILPFFGVFLADRGRTHGRVWLWCGLAIIGTAFALTMSAGGAIAVIGQLVFLLWILFRKLRFRIALPGPWRIAIRQDRSFLRYRLTSIAFVGLVVCGVIVGVFVILALTTDLWTMLVAAFVSRFSTENTAESTITRGYMYLASFQLAREYPWLGVGPGRTPHMLQLYLPLQQYPALFTATQWPGSIYLDALVEYGIVGLSLLLVPYGAAFRRLFRAMRIVHVGDRRFPVLLALSTVLVGVSIQNFFVSGMFRSYSWVMLSLAFSYANACLGGVVDSSQSTSRGWPDRSTAADKKRG